VAVHVDLLRVREPVHLALPVCSRNAADLVKQRFINHGNSACQVGHVVKGEVALMSHLYTSTHIEQGVDDYEPRVVHQLLDFMYAHVSGVLQDAEARFAL
jgi:hypothetical protein